MPDSTMQNIEQRFNALIKDIGDIERQKIREEEREKTIKDEILNGMKELAALGFTDEQLAEKEMNRLTNEVIDIVMEAENSIEEIKTKI